MSESKLMLEKETFSIRGACFEVYNYLKATGHRVGLLVNFGHHPGLEIERIAR